RKAMAAGLACVETCTPPPGADRGVPRDSYGEFMGGLYKLFKPPSDRVIGGGVNETIDASVWQHARLADYRSPSLERALRNDVITAPPGVA
ncbi:MAG: DUF2235 domain-containing protein, partial [Xanthomonadaceae bacterium]|nr:DUF2235 domain-containing protein [Xanthomonadaceae bacterium]